jgi:hypothetical protein
LFGGLEGQHVGLCGTGWDKDLFVSREGLGGAEQSSHHSHGLLTRVKEWYLLHMLGSRVEGRVEWRRNIACYCMT